jgi:hypothetical protein
MIVHPPIATSTLMRDDLDALAAKVKAQIASRFVPCDP